MTADPRNRALMVTALAGLPEWDRSGEGETFASTPCVKLFMVDGGGRWFLSEKDTTDPGNVRYFGLCDLSMGMPELGWVDDYSLMTVKGWVGLGVELDEHFDGTIADGYGYVGEPVPAWMGA